MIFTTEETDDKVALSPEQEWHDRERRRLELLERNGGWPWAMHLVIRAYRSSSCRRANAADAFLRLLAQRLDQIGAPAGDDLASLLPQEGE